jgi:hypothetical protein
MNTRHWKYHINFAAWKKPGLGPFWIFFALAILLAAMIPAFWAGHNFAGTIIFAALLAFLFFSLIFFQLKFYRDGDRKMSLNSMQLPSTEVTSSASHLKSPRHRAIWENMAKTRRLMKQKEKEFLQRQIKKETRALGLSREEHILFMADRSRLYFWPLVLISALSLFIAAAPSRALPASLSFAFLILSLSGLLALTAFRFPTRYYLTNFRILVRRTVPLGREHWSYMNYQSVSSVSGQQKLAWLEITLKSSKNTIYLRGLPKDKATTLFEILRQKLSCSSSI